MLYMVIEAFKGGNGVAVYRRFAEKGRMLPEGLLYRGSWVTADGERCFQLMECEDEALLEQWMAGWRDLVEFEVTPVVSSQQMAALHGDSQPPG